MTISVFPGSVPDLGIQLDSPEWFEWLTAQSQFKYEGNLTTMSVKRRASNGKWYARKKVYSSDKGSIPVDLYIGGNEECTSEKLKEINYRFGQDWRDFWHWYHSPARKESKEKGVQTKEVYTEEQSTAQTNLPPENFKETTLLGECLESYQQQKHVIEAYRSEAEELQTRIASLEKENAQLKGRISYLLDERGMGQAKMNDDARFEIERLQKLNDELERENIQLNRVYSQSEDISRKYLQRATEAESRVAQLEQSNSKLQAANQSLEKQLSECSQQLTPEDLIRKKVKELGMQEKLMQHQGDPKSNVRYWALARLLEALD